MLDVASAGAIGMLLVPLVEGRFNASNVSSFLMADATSFDAKVRYLIPKEL